MLESTKFERGCKVKWSAQVGITAYGEVTIVREDDCKVMFDSSYDLNYDYYPKSELTIVTEEEYAEANKSP